MRRLFEDDDRGKLDAQDAEKIARIPLKGNLKGFWALTVRANWRVIFRFDGQDALDIDLIDYH